MSDAAIAISSAAPIPSRSSHYIRSAAVFVRTKPLGAIGASMILALVVIGTIGTQLVGDPYLIDVSERLVGPSGEHYLGTDDRGRDVLARVVHGTRVSLEVGILAALIGVGIGVVVGLGSGYIGGLVDTIVQRIVDSFLAFPALLLAIAFTVAMGRSVLTIALSLGVIGWPTVARVIRSSVLSQKNTQYVLAARAVGASDLRVAFRHLLPNLASIVIVLFTATIAQAILTEAALSFLGVGIQAPTPSLGSMIRDAQPWAERAPWFALFPGIAIAAAVFGFNLFGDAIRDVLDPRLRSR